MRWWEESGAGLRAEGPAAGRAMRQRRDHSLSVTLQRTFSSRPQNRPGVCM